MRELICTAQNYSTRKDARGEIQITMQDVRIDQQTDMADLIAEGDLWAVAEKLIEHGFFVTPPVGTSLDFESGALSKPLPF